MPPSSRDEIRRRITTAENKINQCGAQLKEIELVFEQAENLLKTHYRKQRKHIQRIYPLLVQVLEQLKELRAM